MKQGEMIVKALFSCWPYILVAWSSLETADAARIPILVEQADQLQVSSTKHEVMVEAPIDFKIQNADVELQRESHLLAGQKAGLLEVDALLEKVSRRNSRSDDEVVEQPNITTDDELKHPYLTGFKRISQRRQLHSDHQTQNEHGGTREKQPSPRSTFQTQFQKQQHYGPRVDGGAFKSRGRRPHPQLTPADNITLDDVPDNGRGVNTNGYHRVISQVSEVLNGLGPHADVEAVAAKKADNYDKTPWQPLMSYPARPTKHFRAKQYSTPPTPKPPLKQHHQQQSILGGPFSGEDDDDLQDDDAPQKGLQTSPTESHHDAVGFFDEYLIEFDDEEGKKVRHSRPASGRSLSKKPASKRTRNSADSFNNYDTNDDYVDYDDPSTEDDAGNRVQQQHQQKEFSGRRPPYPPPHYGQNFGREANKSPQKRPNLHQYLEPEEATGEGSSSQGDGEEEGDEEDYNEQQQRPNQKPNYGTYRAPQSYLPNRPSPRAPQLTGPNQEAANEEEEEDPGEQHQETGERQPEGEHEEERQQDNLAPYEEDNDNIEEGVMKELGNTLYPDKNAESHGGFQDIPRMPQDEPELEQESDHQDIGPNSEYTEHYGDKPTPLYRPNEVQQLLQQQEQGAGPEDSSHDNAGEHEHNAENEPQVQDDEEDPTHPPQPHQGRKPQGSQDGQDEGEEEHPNQPETEGVAYKDDNQWDDYFDGHRKGIESDIHNLAKNSESYNAPEGSQQDDGQQEEQQDQQEEEGPPPGTSEAQEGGSQDEEEPAGEEDQRGRAPPKSVGGGKKDPRERRVASSHQPKNDYDAFRELQTQVEQGSKKRSDSGVEAAPLLPPSPTAAFGETTVGNSRISRDSSLKSFSTADIPGFDDFFTKLQKNVENEIKLEPPFYSGGAADKWSLPSYDGEDKDKPADGVIDNSEDLRPTKYADNDHVSPEDLAWQMPSHEELQENYKTVVTSDSNTDPVTLPWSPSKIVTTPNAPPLELEDKKSE